ncbi:MAG: serine/threonine protein kinase, partial [Acidobacteriota bacterium]|nr:serine/threonine protein kinase [Acidobacteriota bacterium]
MANTRSPIPVRFGSSTADERDFYQERIRLFAWCVFLISGGFYVTDVTFSAPVLGVVTALLWTPKLLNLTGTLLAGAIWLAARPSQPSLAMLQRLDAGGTIALSTCYGLMVLAALDVERLAPLMRLDPWRAVTDPLMACSYVALVRALVVPSRPRRTVWITTLAMLPVVALGPYVLRNTMNGLEVWFASLDLAMWSSAAIAVSAIASRVIFGLRTEVAKIRRLGQYTLEEKIGEGGMGIVYRASPAMLRRPTAIKLLRPDRMDEASLLRFEREVQLTAALTHPNTVAIFDFGRTPDGIFYYAMEYLDGFNLDQVVAVDGPLPPARVLHLLWQVCGSLAEAHGVGLIHRDVKPANILLVERGGVPDVVKVVDFGLAKRVGPDDDSVTVALTTADVIQGTPLYISPEAIRNDATLDARSDLYAVGAVGYFLLTGAPVFRANSVVEVLAHHLQTQPEAPSR